METDAYIAMGSNIGDRELNLLRAVAEVGKLPASRVTALSSFYETSPVGPVTQDSFYNAVFRLATKLDAHNLLEHLLRIEETVFGRMRTVYQGPRRMDLDLLLFGDMIINNDHLIVPHPRLAERRFVLQPLSEIAPDLKLPFSGKSVRDLLVSLHSGETVVRL